MGMERWNVARVLENSKSCSKGQQYQKNLLGNPEFKQSERHLEHVHTVLEGRLCRKHSPVRVFLQDLIDADAEGLVIVTFVDEIFVYPKLGSSHCLPLWDTRQVKTELSVMPSNWQELLIVLHWKKKKRERGKRLG